MAGGDPLRTCLSRPGHSEESPGRCHDGPCHHEFPARRMGDLEGGVEFLVIFEDDDLLVVNKPAGLNTHAPDRYSGEGLYEWLRHREPRWASLAIIHRLDKETSGVIVFAKTPKSNRSLTQQFAGRRVKKKYLLLTDREVPDGEFEAKSCLVRAGERYLSRPVHVGGQLAETRFRPVGTRGFEPGSERLHHLGAPASLPASFSERKCAGRDASAPGAGVGCYNLVEAEPLTGRTHQIRVHAAESAFPILGDTLYGGTPEHRVCLHAAEITLRHPATGETVNFHVPAEFGADARLSLRSALIEPKATNAYRLIHGGSDGWVGWFVDRLGDFLLSQSEGPLAARRHEELARLSNVYGVRGAYHKPLTRHIREPVRSEVCPQPIYGEAAPERFTILENGLSYEISFGEGYSVGLFLDQRDNRRRLLTGHVAAGFSLWPPPRPRSRPRICSQGRAPGFENEIRDEDEEEGEGRDACPSLLNTFAYTCGFSVCAARAGAHTTSLDLSKKYLEWGKRNFEINGLDPAEHDFIHGDVFDWLRRLAKKHRLFAVVLLAPPTVSPSKVSGAFC